jgi:hypothetical protein
LIYPASRTEGDEMHWVVRFNPDRWDPVSAFESTSVGQSLEIPVNQQSFDSRRFRSGHRVVIWVAGVDPGIVALVRVAASPATGDVPLPDGFSAWLPVIVDARPGTRLRPESLNEDAQLADLTVLRKRGGFCTTVESREWAALRRLIMPND